MSCTPTIAFSKRLLLFNFILFISIAANAQKNSIKGIVIDTAEKKKLQYAIVALIDLKDSTLYKSIRSTEDGSFLLSAIVPGKYQLMISYPRMADYLEEIDITSDTKKDFGKIPMVLEAVLLADVVVRYVPPIRMRGDTLEYTADSFMVKPGANVQELLKRLPGITVDKNGKITAQGKEVQKILVDGDEFFSDDPGLASKYLNANAVDKVQVFDKKSESTEFTGIDDGQRTKTINLKLKANMKNGYFGKVSTAADAKNYYNHDAMGALFHGPEKMSVFGLASKTGAAGLANRDLVKYVGQDYERIEDGTRGLVLNNSNNDYESDSYNGTGIPTVLYGGAHYSNKWRNDKEKLFTNYRAKHIDASGWRNSKSTTILPGGTSFYNTSNTESNVSSQTQKAGGNFTIPVDSFSVIKISVNSNWSNGKNKDTTYSDSKNEKDFFVNNSRQAVTKISDGRGLSANIIYEKKFRKVGKTLSVAVQQEDSRNNEDRYNYAANTYFDPSTGNYKNSDTLDQLQRQMGSLKSVGAQARFSNRFGDHFATSVAYGWKWADARNAFSAFNNNNGKYINKIDTLSNDYDFISTTQIAEAVLSWNEQKFNISVGSKFFFTGFQQRDNDLSTANKRNFINYAPSINITRQFKITQSLSFSYRGQTYQPSVEQLQPLRKSSNPLYVRLGNPDLRPSLNHSFSINYNSYNWQKGSNFYVFASSNYTQNDITSKSSTDSNNRTISQYVNLNGIPNFNISTNYGWEYKKIHVRPSIGLNASNYGNYTLLNGVKNKSNNASLGINMGVRYQLKDVMEISYNNRINYSIGTTTINNITTRNFSHSHNIEATFYLPWKLELASNADLTFQPRNASFNDNFNIIQWNASIIKKVLKNDMGQIKFSINDILNNNTGYSRSVSGGNTYESNRLVIKRYVLLGFIYNFSKNFK